MRRWFQAESRQRLTTGLGCEVPEQPELEKAHTMTAFNNTTCTYCLYKLVPMEMHKSIMFPVNPGTPSRTFSTAQTLKNTIMTWKTMKLLNLTRDGNPAQHSIWRGSYNTAASSIPGITKDVKLPRFFSNSHPLHNKHANQPLVSVPEIPKEPASPQCNALMGHQARLRS